jgi:aryl-alcohol dehydrogenase-like predicted oxidoreductase
MAQFALRWIVTFPEVTCAISGAKNPQRAEDNAQAASLPALNTETMLGVQEIYDTFIRSHVQHLW